MTTNIEAKALSSAGHQSRRASRLARAGLTLVCALGLLAFVASPASARKTHLLEGKLGSSSELRMGAVGSIAIDQDSGDLTVIESEPQNEIQAVGFGSFAEGDTFKLTFKGESTALITYSATGSQLSTNIRNALIAKFGSGNFAIQGSTPTRVILEFGGAYLNSSQPLMECTKESGGGSCSVAELADGHIEGVTRFHENGTSSPFSALGTYLIDGKGTGQCATVPADCDQTPQNGLTFNSFSQEMQIAIDQSGTATDGNIYVIQADSVHLIDVFASSGKYLGQITGAGATPFTSGPGGVTVDSTGNLFVSANGNIYKFDPSGSTPLNSDHVATFTSVAQPYLLAAGAGPTAGFLFVLSGDGVVSKLDATTGAFKYVVDPLSNAEVAVDPNTGHVYIYNNAEFVFNSEVREYDASGAAGAVAFSRFATSSAIVGLGVALAIRGSTGKVFVGAKTQNNGFVQIYGPVVTLPDVSTGATTITGDTNVTLNGTVNPDGDPIDECRFEYGLTTAYGQIAPCEETLAEIGSGTVPKAVHADLAGLATETVYHVRLVAENANGTVNGPDQTFQTPSKPGITSQWVAAVGPTEATVKATINPGNSLTTFRVEWGTGTSYGESTGEIAVGSDATLHTVSAVLSGLTPATTYHWRVVATNTIDEVEGPDRSFRTYPEAAPALPDERVYELVSPLDKNGAEVGVPIPAGGAAEFTVEPQQTSPSGDAITYGSFTAFGEEPESAPATSQYLSTRGPEGWSTDNINPRFEEGFLRDPAVGFSPDLSHAAVIAIEPELTADALVDQPNIYQRDNATGVLTALTTEADKALFPDGCISYGGTSTDSKVVIFAVGSKLFEWSASLGTRLVSVLPDEAPASAAAHFGAGGANQCDMTTALVRHAISADGSRIFWTSASFGTIPNPLFARVNGTQTIQLDAPNSGVGGKGGEGRYRDASVDGSKVFFTSAKKLTATLTTAGSTDLFLYDFNQEEGQRLTNLTAHVGEAAGVQKVLGASEDGSFVYFVANGVLDTGATTGQPNVYVWHVGDGIRHLFTADLGDTRVSADGTHIAVVSTNSLTGFDNTVATGSGCVLADEGLVGSSQCAEMFLYDYGADDLNCVSCSSAETRPLGPALAPASSTPYEVPRYLSADGSRLFFETFDSLGPQDTNGKRDVYEFEKPGAGSCTSASAAFDPAAGGCVYLISTGSSSDESYFLDASTNGNDAFISTRESLVFMDQDGRFDVYDARVGGTTPVPPPPPGCEGEGCRGQGTAAPPASAPGTAAFEGPGDPKPTRGCPKGRRMVKKGGETRCVKKHHKRKHHKRTTHHKQRTSR